MVLRGENPDRFRLLVSLQVFTVRSNSAEISTNNLQDNVMHYTVFDYVYETIQNMLGSYKNTDKCTPVTQKCVIFKYEINVRNIWSFFLK